jgi:hypothetical protein
MAMEKVLGFIRLAACRLGQPKFIYSLIIALKLGAKAHASMSMMIYIEDRSTCMQQIDHGYESGGFTD